MANFQVTKDFQTFVDSVYIEHYQETYDLYQAAMGNVEGQSSFSLEPCEGSEDMLLIHEPSNNALRLSPKALDYLPEWIEQKLMDGLDAETFWGMEYAKEKDEWEERKNGNQ